MTTPTPAARPTPKSIVASLSIGAALLAPFLALQLVNRNPLREGFPFVLFAFMAAHAWLIGLSLAPALGRLRTERRLGALAPGHRAGLALAAFLGYLYAGVVADQLPCFLGVPNCD